MNKVTIIDYGIGNILSVKRGFEYIGSSVCITETTEDIESAEYLVLPGVGAFADGMTGLQQKGLINAIINYTKRNKPFLGICLGMQMMLDESEEFGTHKGLGIIPGKVIGIDKCTVDGEPHKVPHIGWNKLHLPDSKTHLKWDNTLLDGVPIFSEVYFVHSFTAVPEQFDYRLADSYYGGRLISAIIKKGNAYGCQFHPEKSGEVGLQILRNFINLRCDNI
jgi:glutamine amidotransferase